MFPKPDDLFKQAFTQWEQQTAEFWNNMLRNPSFLKSAWQAVEASLQGQQQANEALERNLAAWGLPSRRRQEEIQHQLNRLQLLLGDVDERLDELSDQLDRLERGDG